MKTQETTMNAFELQHQDVRTGQPLDVLGVPTLVKIAGSDVEGRTAMFHLTVPSMGGPPLHRHHREDEWLYVLDGEITFRLTGNARWRARVRWRSLRGVRGTLSKTSERLP